MNDITNTTTDEATKLGIFVGGFDGSEGVGRAIQASEARGQAELVASTKLPRSQNGDQVFLDLGFTFGEPVPGDDLFREATLPEGWERQASDHDMWSYIVDERGIRRVAIFYKAAFYDREAFMHTQRVSGEVRSVLYGDESTLPDWVALLTDEERADTVTDLTEAIRQIEESGHRWPGDPERAARYQAAIEALSQ